MITIKELQELLDPYYREMLDCDGQSRVIHYVLTEKEIKHKLYFGSIEIKGTNKGFAPHMWVELKAKDGGVRIDYKARKCLGPEDETIPHGVYLKEEYSQMIYRGSQTTEKPFPKKIIDVLLDPDLYKK